MAEPTFSMAVDDDLPRTIRRQRDAREREAREREARDAREHLGAATSVPAIQHEGSYATAAAPAATVTAIDISFAQLSAFFLKAVLAAIPALLLLTVLLWLFGQGLQAFFPQLLKLKILIYMPPQ
jgi:hypothetical protein